MISVGALVASLSLDNKRFVMGMKTAGKTVKPLQKDLVKLGKTRFEALKKNIFSLKGAVLGLAGAYGLKKLAGSFVDAASTAEQYRIRLTALLGSAEEGNRLFQDMAKYAGAVPFEYEKIMSAATQLSGIMKGGVDEIKQWMPLIGDLAAVSGLGIEKTTEQIVRMYSAGAASADLFRERGITAMLGFQTGVSYSAEETRRMLIEAWEDPMSKFRDATKELAKSWSGLLSMMSDKWFQFRNLVMEAGVFEELKDLLTDINIRFGEWLKVNEELIKQKVPEYIERIKESFAKLVPVLGEVAGALEKIKTVYDILPSGVVGAAGVGVIWRVLGGSIPHAILIGAIAHVAMNLKDLRWSLNEIGRMGGIPQIIPSWKETKKAGEQIKDLVRAIRSWAVSSKDLMAITAKVEVAWMEVVGEASKFGYVMGIVREVTDSVTYSLEKERKKAEDLGKAYLVLQREMQKAAEVREALRGFAYDIGLITLELKTFRLQSVSAWEAYKKGTEEATEAQKEAMAKLAEIRWEGIQSQMEAEYTLEMAVEEGLKRSVASFQATEEAKKNIAKTAAMTMLQNWAYAFKEMGKQSKSAFKMFKAISIAETIINTIAAAQAAFKAMAGIPIVGPALAIAAAAAAIAAGMARVAQISAMTPEGGGVSVAAGGAGPAVGTYPVSPTTGIPPFPGGEREAKPSFTLVIEGDFYGEEDFINRMAERLSEAVENRSVRVVSSEVL